MIKRVYDLRDLGTSILEPRASILDTPTPRTTRPRAYKSLAATGGHVREIMALVSVSAPLHLQNMQALMACGSRYVGNEGARHALTLCSTPVVEPLRDTSTMARW